MLLAAEQYLFKSAALFLLLFNAFLSVVQELPLVLLRVSALSSQLCLLPLVSLRSLFVLLLQTLEVPPQGGLTRHIEDWTDGQKRILGTIINTDTVSLVNDASCMLCGQLWQIVITLTLYHLLDFHPPRHCHCTHTLSLLKENDSKEKPQHHIKHCGILTRTSYQRPDSTSPSFAYLSLPFSCVFGQYGLLAEFELAAQWVGPWWKCAWAAALWMAGWYMFSPDRPLWSLWTSWTWEEGGG